MGLDSVNLQVLSTAGSESEKRNASKVLRLLERGRHWVLVVLLLSNVIGKSDRLPYCSLMAHFSLPAVNEALPVFLSDFGGTWAVLA
jgi:metal transporter CNNM